MPTPAQKLLGLTLNDGWKVVDRIQPTPQGTGGTFSQNYIVESAQGKRAFLKALDFSKAFAHQDPARALQPVIEAYNFERDILKRCRSLSRVVTAIGDGTAKVGESELDVVQYLVFELADGDLRSFRDVSGQFNTAWSLRSLHHVATALEQLHGQSIAHQDIKPSNILVFDGDSCKLSDLGRCVDRSAVTQQPPHLEFPVAGDPAYAPPELLYRSVDTDWEKRRLACDVYLLGSMLAFFFTRTGTTPLLMSHLRAEHHYRNWGDTYAAVMPYIRDAFDRAMETFVDCVATELRDDLEELMRQLCEPDPAFRGHPRDRIGVGSRYSVRRYVSRFNLLASKVEYGLLRM